MSEETGMIATQAVTISIDAMTTALVKEGVTEAVIESLSRHLALDVPILDKDGREVVRLAHRHCRDIVGIIEAVGKEERDEAVKYQRFVLAEVKSRVKRIDPIADKLKQRLLEYDNQETLRVQEEAKAWWAKVEARKNKLWETGFEYNPIEKKFFYEDPRGGAIGFSDDDLQRLGFDDAALDETCAQVAEHIRTLKEIEAAQQEQSEAEQEAKAAADKELREKLDRLAEFERKEKEAAGLQTPPAPQAEASYSGGEAALRRADSGSLFEYRVYLHEIAKPPTMQSTAGKELQERLAKGLSFMTTLIDKFIQHTPDATDPE